VFELADHRNAWPIFLEVLDPGQYSYKYTCAGDNESVVLFLLADSDKDCLPDYDFRSTLLQIYLLSSLIISDNIQF